jgi:glyoxylase-like metal-dependent hydrolase (beta-lactamase superfamily II)
MPIEERLPGLLSVRLPLPLQLNHVYAHLLRRDEGWMLIDTGIGDDASMNVLDEALIEAGIQWSDVHDVFLTHTHPDHIGGLAEVRKRARPRVWLGEHERAALVDAAAHGEHADWFTPTVTAAGASPAEVESMQEAFRKVRHIFTPIEPDIVLHGGETIPSTIGELVTVLTPGHSLGHLCLHVPQRRFLICGDHLLPNITPNISWAPGRDMLGEYQASLDLIQPLDVTWMLPSHGNTFAGLAGWIASTRLHHGQRCMLLINGLSSGPRTPRDLVSSLWSGVLSPWNLRFAIYEVLAHLEYLARRGAVRTIGGTFPSHDRILEWENAV